MKDSAHESDAEPAPAAAAVMAPATAAPTVARVLGLQQTAGNRAVGKLLRLKDPVNTGTVKQEIEEDLLGMNPEGETKVHWISKFGFEITDDEVIGLVKLRLSLDPGVTEDQASKARQGARKEFQRLFDSKFKVVEVGNVWNTRRTLRLGIDWVDDANEAQHIVTLHSGPPTTSEGTNKSNWHVAEPDIVHAHETGHLFGLLDEYQEAGVADRNTETDKGVKKDHSIMGRYPIEGVEQASMKDRHALKIAKAIYVASGRLTSNLKVEAV